MSTIACISAVVGSMARLPDDMSIPHLISFVGSTILGTAVGWSVSNTIDWAAFHVTGQTMSTMEVVRSELEALVSTTETSVARLTSLENQLEWNGLLLSTQPAVDRILYKFGLLRKLNPEDKEALCHLVGDVLDSNNGLFEMGQLAILFNAGIGADLLMLHHALVGFPLSGERPSSILKLCITARSSGSRVLASDPAEIVVRANKVIDALVKVQLCGLVLMVNAYKYRKEDYLANAVTKEIYDRLTEQAAASKALDIVTSTSQVSLAPLGSSKGNTRGKVHTSLTVGHDGNFVIAASTVENGHPASFSFAPVSSMSVSTPYSPLHIFPHVFGYPAISCFNAKLVAVAFTSDREISIAIQEAPNKPFSIQLQRKLENVIDHNAVSSIRSYKDMLVASFGHPQMKSSVVAISHNGLEWSLFEVNLPGVPVFIFDAREQKSEAKCSTSTGGSVNPGADQVDPTFYVVVASPIKDDLYGFFDYILVGLSLNKAANTLSSGSQRLLLSGARLETSFGIFRGKLFALEYAHLFQKGSQEITSHNQAVIRPKYHHHFWSPWAKQPTRAHSHLLFGTEEDPLSLSCSVECALTEDDIDTGIEFETPDALTQVMGVATIGSESLFSLVGIAGKSPDGRTVVVSFSRPFGDKCDGSDCQAKLRQMAHDRRENEEAARQALGRSRWLCIVM